jgi:aspartate-semialdehyde dehydrogenase
VERAVQAVHERFRTFAEERGRCLRRASASSAPPAQVGTVTLELLRERGYDNVRVFASARSAGKQLGPLTIEEATPETLEAGGVDVFLFSVGTSASRALVPHAVRGGAAVVDKSAAFRLEPGIPLVVPEVNGARRSSTTASSPTRTAARSRSRAC